MNFSPVFSHRRTTLALLAVITLATGMDTAGAQAPQYAVTDLGTLGGFDSTAYGINDVGQITGGADAADNGQHAFLYTSDGMVNIDTLGNVASTGYAINNLGQVVGTANFVPDAPNDNVGFLYASGSMSYLPGTGAAYAINDAGQIAGSAGIHGFLYSSGTYTTIYAFNGPGGSSNALGINGTGQVVGTAAVSFGSQAFLYNGGTMTDLNSSGANASSSALAINDLGQATGVFNKDLFLYSGGVLTSLGDLGGGWSWGYAINNAGQIVGKSLVTDGNNYDALLYSNGTLYDLNSLIINLADTDFSYLDCAYDINNSGTIVGEGVTTGGDTHAFEAQLVPTPEPTAGVLLFAAAVTVATLRRPRGR